jgi:hypothetical protein
MTSVLVLQHTGCETLGTVADPRTILTQAKPNLPQLQQIGAEVFSRWADLL